MLRFVLVMVKNALTVFLTKDIVYVLGSLYRFGEIIIGDNRISINTRVFKTVGMLNKCKRGCARIGSTLSRSEVFLDNLKAKISSNFLKRLLRIVFFLLMPLRAKINICLKC